MLLMRRRKFIKRISIITAQICLLLMLIIFVFFPIIFSYSITLQRGMLFLTFIRHPKNLDLTKPEALGLYATRNFYLTVKEPIARRDEDIRLGVWHVLPRQVVKRFSRELKVDEAEYEDLQSITMEPDEHLNSLEPILKSEFPEVNEDNNQLFFERMLKLPGTVVLYLHGNTATRGTGHRTEIYKLLRNLNYHVLALDYRGYADSDPVSPTEDGVVNDAMAVYEYISNISSNPIFIWGHSLGTGVATHLCARLNYLNEEGPRGLVLESPFTNIREEIRKHPFSRPFRNLPWFDVFIAKPMYKNSLRFESDRHIGEFRQPIMIIHAEDDYVVPFQLGYKLYRTALEIRNKAWGPVEFHRFDGDLHYGHKFLCRAPELPELVKTFVNSYRNVVY